MSDMLEFILTLVIMILAIVGSASKKARQAKQAAMNRQADAQTHPFTESTSDYDGVFQAPTQQADNSENKSGRFSPQSNNDYLEPMARMQANKNKKYENIAPKSQIEMILLETEEESEPIQLDLDNLETVKKAFLYKEILDPKFDH